ncbi:cytochrome c biogenesis CcdA family protein [Blastococcus capsensis]|uniref:cytochrome c biogenesis CcdA family protein n=1 Tax=Blastococcus capsensis TaxID=1564163 RepID=UPI0025400CAC|nr:cytochrome c biogenesis protein CcdA [Blastococcus capsensis]MDK3256729.1 cytochrome c biogenesis protein CcdA [Blastococcus capsensis]
MDPGLLTLALLAGAVAALNPCGFALLPAYLGLLVAAPQRDRVAATGRAVRFALGMTTGFVLVFGTVGLVLMPVLSSLQQYLPVLTVVIGLVLVVVGLWLVAGRSVAVPGLAGRGRPPTSRWTTQVGFGVSFALASLSCTLAPFLAVTAGSLRAGGPLGVGLTFVSYAVGMGTVVLALSVAVALARTSVVRSMRRTGALINRGSGLLLVLAGGYVAWYGWFEIRVLSGGSATDPVVSAAVQVQAALSRWVADLGAPGLIAVALVTAVVLLSLLRRSWSRRTVESLP